MLCATFVMFCCRYTSQRLLSPCQRNQTMTYLKMWNEFAESGEQLSGGSLQPGFRTSPG